MKWQPMNTAPTNGSRVLLKGQIRVTFGENLSVVRITGIAIGSYSSTSKWSVEGNGLNRMHPPEQKHFTGWMPLPKL